MINYLLAFDFFAVRQNWVNAKIIIASFQAT